jgi:FixJ family two-component response regulator
VLVLDDDPGILKGLKRLLTDKGYRVECFSRYEELFKFGPPELPSCLILDNQLGDGMSGFEVHAELVRRKWDLPTLFLTAHWNVRSVVQAMRNGADTFITKPFEPSELCAAVESALGHARLLHRENHHAILARRGASQLTSREREIVHMVCAGLLNKEIADRLELALVTVKVHRARAMRKMGAGNGAELARIATLAGIFE